MNGNDSHCNGITLCPTHHTAFDSLLFTINPNGQELILEDGFNKEELGITKTSFNLNLNEKDLAFRLSMFNEANSKIICMRVSKYHP
tara:strand:+ start:179 stop:439 length:261 start_codon:yes stop_codon:yes gene_type:complete